MGWFIAALVVGGIAKAVGGILEGHQTRENNREEAERQKELAEYRKNTALGTMQRELGVAMEGDYLAYGDIQNQLAGEITSSAQGTYIGQLAAEDQYTGLLASNERASGELVAQQGASGTKQDITLQTVIDSELRANANTQRTQIDKGLEMNAYRNKLVADSGQEQLERLGRKYEPNSAFMRLYDYKRERITGETKLQTSYLDDIIRSNQYNAGWFFSDLLGVTAAASDTATAGYSMGLWG